MKYLLAVLAALLAVACSTYPPPAAIDHRTPAERAEAMSVALLDWEDGQPNCGGVWVSRNEILTALHCVEDNGRPAVAADPLLEALGLDLLRPEWNPLGQVEKYRMKGSDEARKSIVARVDKKHDLALLQTFGDQPEHGVAAIRSTPLHDGEDLDVVGSTIGLPFSYSHCAVSSATRETWKVQVAGPVYFGNSGGGAFDDHGRLVGIAIHMRRTSRGIVPDVSFFAGQAVLAGFVAAS